jgi:hypothetical protein
LEHERIITLGRSITKTPITGSEFDQSGTGKIKATGGNLAPFPQQMV